MLNRRSQYSVLPCRHHSVVRHRGYGLGWRSLSIFALAQIGLLASFAVGPAPKADFATVDPEASSWNRLQAYAANVQELRSVAIARGAITYSEVLEAIYPDTAELSSFLAAKQEWRSEYGGRFVFLSDYSTIGEYASISETTPTRNSSLGSTMIGRYEPRAHAIKIAHTASDFAIVHEAGHALQHKALADRSIRRSKSVTFTEVERNLRSASLNSSVNRMTARRLRYLASQDEFEVRLQDLNRFHALALGHGPIMNPLDAVRALTQLGLKLDGPSVAQALDGTPWSLTSEEASRFIANETAGPDYANFSRQFDDAYEFKMLQELSERTDEAELWPHLLRKILFEAPGHL